MSETNKDQLESFLDQTITLTLDNDIEVECEVIAIFPVDDQMYMALLPIEEVADITTDELFIYRYNPSDDESEGVDLSVIEDDDEYEKVADALDALLESEDFLDDEIEE